jgi:hypothetical protein
MAGQVIAVPVLFTSGEAAPRPGGGSSRSAAGHLKAKPGTRINPRTSLRRGVLARRSPATGLLAKTEEEYSMRPSNKSLIADYMRDLEVEIETNARLIPAGRVDLIEYDTKCKAELARLKSADIIAVDRYGIPKIIA